MLSEEGPEVRGDDNGVLSEDDCRRLLATRTLGRVGLTSGALPVIMPVEYVYEDDVITFRTEHDAKLRSAAHGDVLAFEVDAYDSVSGHGWSVHVLGRATVLAADHEIAPLPTLDLEHPDEPRRHYVRLHCEILTGRRLISSRD
jgi:nitroimidazol reductase NimA-like FMN-containing flavoprotein (pyridoxamine 5'-phosphate oxidase superfamily)